LRDTPPRKVQGKDTSLQTVLLALSTKAMRLRSDDRPFPVASATNRFHFPAIRRASAAASESPITSSTHRLTSAARSTPLPSTGARTPTRQSRTASVTPSRTATPAQPKAPRVRKPNPKYAGPTWKK